MGLLARIEQRATVLQPAHPSVDEMAWVDGKLFAGQESHSGIRVNEWTAMNFTAVYAAVRLLAGGLAGLPLILYRRRGDDRERADDHPLYPILKDQFNPTMTSFVARETMQAGLLLWGNAYAEKEWNRNRDRILSLLPVSPDRVTVKSDSRRDAAGRITSRRILYEVRNSDGRPVQIPQERMLHVPGLGFNGLVGRPPLAMVREAIALGLAAERFSASFFGRGAFTSGWVKYPTKLTPEAKQRLRDSIETVNAGVDRSFRVGVLDEGMDWMPNTMPLDDAQLLQSRAFQVREIARIFGIPPHLLQDEERATFSNIEHQGINYVVHSLRPWLVRWEQEISRQLLSEEDRRAGYFAEFKVDGLLRGDTKSRYEGYQIARRSGWMNANEIRRLENQNPIPEEEGGDTYIVEGNMTKLSALPDGPPESPADGAPRAPSAGRSEDRSAEWREIRQLTSLKARWRLRDLFEELITEEAQRLVNRVVQRIQGALGRIETDGMDAFLVWLREYMVSEAPTVRRILGPVLKAYIKAIAAEVERETDADADRVRAEIQRFEEEYLDVLGKRYTEGHLGQLEALAAEAESDEAARDALAERVGQWAERDPAKIGSRESTQASGATAVFVYAVAGITILRWATRGESCPYCNAMNGRTVEIRRPFAQAGDVVEGGERGPLKVKTLITHPPLHGGCDCNVRPG